MPRQARCSRRDRRSCRPLTQKKKQQKNKKGEKKTPLNSIRMRTHVKLIS